MTANERSRSERALKNLLKQDGVSITEIIAEPSFKSKLKSSYRPLSDFLLQDDTINEICDWLLTEEYCELKNYRATASNMMRIFKECPEALQASFSQSDRLIARVLDFSKSQKAQTPINCGFFEQIVENFAASSQGSFLQNFKRLPFMLAKRIEIISIRHLFFVLASSFPQQFGFSSSVVLFILHNLSERNKEQVMMLFLKLAKSKSSFPAFDHSKVVASLLEVAISPDHNEFVTTQAFQIVEVIQKSTNSTENFEELIKRFFDKHNVESLPINYGTAVALSLFKKFVPSLVMSMVTNPTHMFMHAAILKTIENASDDVLIPFIEENNIPGKLIWAANVAKSNGFLTKFAQILESKKQLSECLQTPEWNKFVNEQLKIREEILNKPPPPNSLKKRKLKQLTPAQKQQIQQQLYNMSKKPFISPNSNNKEAPESEQPKAEIEGNYTEEESKNEKSKSKETNKTPKSTKQRKPEQNSITTEDKNNDEKEEKKETENDSNNNNKENMKNKGKEKVRKETPQKEKNDKNENSDEIPKTEKENKIEKSNGNKELKNDIEIKKKKIKSEENRPHSETKKTKDTNDDVHNQLVTPKKKEEIEVAKKKDKVEESSQQSEKTKKKNKAEEKQHQSETSKKNEQFPEIKNQNGKKNEGEQLKKKHSQQIDLSMPIPFDNSDMKIDIPPTPDSAPNEYSSDSSPVQRANHHRAKHSVRRSLGSLEYESSVLQEAVAKVSKTKYLKADLIATEILNRRNSSNTIYKAPSLFDAKSSNNDNNNNISNNLHQNQKSSQEPSQTFENTIATQNINANDNDNQEIIVIDDDDLQEEEEFIEFLSVSDSLDNLHRNAKDEVLDDVVEITEDVVEVDADDLSGLPNSNSHDEIIIDNFEIIQCNGNQNETNDKVDKSKSLHRNSEKENTNHNTEKTHTNKRENKELHSNIERNHNEKAEKNEAYITPDKNSIRNKEKEHNKENDRNSPTINEKDDNNEKLSNPNSVTQENQGNSTQGETEENKEKALNEKQTETRSISKTSKEQTNKQHSLKYRPPTPPQRNNDSPPIGPTLKLPLKATPPVSVKAHHRKSYSFNSSGTDSQLTIAKPVPASSLMPSSPNSPSSKNSMRSTSPPARQLYTQGAFLNSSDENTKSSKDDPNIKNKRKKEGHFTSSDNNKDISQSFTKKIQYPSSNKIKIDPIRHNSRSSSPSQIKQESLDMIMSSSSPSSSPSSPRNHLRSHVESKANKEKIKGENESLKRRIQDIGNSFTSSSDSDDNDYESLVKSSAIAGQFGPVLSNFYNETPLPITSSFSISSSSFSSKSSRSSSLSHSSNSSIIFMTMFGPAGFIEYPNESDNASSGSSDDEYLFSFKPTPQKFQRGDTFEYIGDFYTNSHNKFGKYHLSRKEKKKTQKSKRILPQLL